MRSVLSVWRGLGRRRRRVPVKVYDAVAGRWVDTADVANHVADADEAAPATLTFTTYNVWFDDLHADARHVAVAGVLAPLAPDVMVFQEMTPRALAILHAQPWIRRDYRSAAVVGHRDIGPYGMVLLTRLPVRRVTYRPLPSELSRGILLCEFGFDDIPLTVCSIHLDSGKRRAGLRATQLRAITRALRGADDAVVLGDFNMRDRENGRITAPYTDLWPALRPGEHGYTEDTSINLMRYDMKDKHRHVRFDRILLKGTAWSASDIELLGTEPLSARLPRIFPSDHFGLRCTLTSRPTP